MVYYRKELRELPDVLDFDGYFFDLDGTLFLGNQLLPGVQDTLRVLRQAEKKILFLTNTTTRTREDCRIRLQHLGLEAHVEEIVTAAFVSAVYLREQQKCNIFVVGESALVQELEEQGIPYTADPLAATHVLVGMDMQFNYEKLHQAMKAVLGGAVLIAANPDPNCPIMGDIIPDTWSMVKAIEAASGVAPLTVIGKPSLYYGSKVLEWSGLAAQRCLMVGDRLETDILFGINNGLSTALVLTGVTSRNDLEIFAAKPDYVWATLNDFAGLCRRQLRA